MGKRTPQILLIEPTWANQVHLPFIQGLLLTVAKAFPEAKLSFLGDKAQIERLKLALPEDLSSSVYWQAWTVEQDSSFLPGAVWKRWRALPSKLLDSADHVLLCSITPSMLNAITISGACNKTAGFFHGNAADFFGWRSRNPFHRWLDISSSSARFAAAGGQLIVLEKHIVESLSLKLPHLAPALHHLPHSVLPQEGSLAANPPDNDMIRVAFAGTTSDAKGFRQFIKLADTLTRLTPGRYEFNAIGFLHSDAASINKSSLKLMPATSPLERTDYISAMRQQHFIFLWQNETYYGNAASGVFYDALNFRLPLLARRTRLLDDYEREGFPTGILFDDINDMVSMLSSYTLKDVLSIHKECAEKLAALRRRFEPEFLAESLSAILPRDER